MIVYLDSNVVIYAVEDPPIWGARALAKLAALRTNGDTLMVSDLTRMECLVGPLKTGDTALEDDYRVFSQHPECKSSASWLPFAIVRL